MKLLRASFVGMKVRHFAQTFAALGGLLTIVNPVFAQTWTRTSAPSNNWVSVAVSADGIKLLAAAGSRAGPFWGSSPGPIYTSADSGATWTLTSAPTQSWSSVACSADGTKAAAVGNGGIFTSTNSGATWTLTSAPNTNYWSAVASSADGSKLVAVGAGVYTSTNSGDTWIQTRAPNSWNSVASSADGTRLVIVGCGGIYTSMDSGGNWSATDASNQCWVAVASSVDGTKLVAASQWMTYLSSDAGAHWISNGAPNWYSTCVASSADGKNLVVAGLDWVHYWYNDTIYTSADSGAIWVPHIVDGKWSSIASSADGDTLVAAADLTGGGIWTSQQTPSPGLRLSPSASDLVLSWTVPSMSFVLQENSDLTTTNWTDVPTSPSLNLTNLRNEVVLSSTNGNWFYRLKH